MKRLFAAALAAFAPFVFGATLNPIQLLNPAGSTAGQVIASSGATSAPAWQTLSLSTLTGIVPVTNGGTGASTAASARTNLGAAASGANTDITSLNGPAIGSATANTAGPTSNSTTVATTGFVRSAMTNNPPPIGSANPSTGAFTTLSATGAATFSVRPTFNGATPYDTSNLTIANYAPLASPTFTGTVTTAALSATTVSASGNDALVYQNASGQSIPNAATTTVTGWTKLFDRVNANFNAATGVFTAPVTGYYRVSATCQFVATAGAVSNQLGWVVTANGVVVAQSPYLIEAAGSTPRAVSVNTIVSLAAGQTLTLGIYQNTGAALALSSTAANNWVAINRVP